MIRFCIGKKSEYFDNLIYKKGILDMRVSLFRCNGGAAVDYLNDNDLSYAPIKMNNFYIFCYDDSSPLAIELMKNLDYMESMIEPGLIFSDYAGVNIWGINEASYRLACVLRDRGFLNFRCIGELWDRFGFSPQKPIEGGYDFFSEGNYAISLSDGAIWASDIPSLEYIKFNALVSQNYISKASHGLSFLSLNEGQNEIKKLVLSDKPFAVTRIGGTESKIVLDYVKGRPYREDTVDWLYKTSGFFSYDGENNLDIDMFCKLTIDSIKGSDIHLSWVPEGMQLINRFRNKKSKISIWQTNSVWKEGTNLPASWVYNLEGKKVLIISSFSETVKTQMSKINDIYKGLKIPYIETYQMIETQGVKGKNIGYRDFFEAYEKILLDIDKIDFDIALISGGAYGYPLAVEIKKMGKQAIELCSSLPLLFGVKMKRHLQWPYINKYWDKNWVWPIDPYPQNYETIENGCYWR